jgi:hypothetical protein
MRIPLNARPTISIRARKFTTTIPMEVDQRQVKVRTNRLQLNNGQEI